MLGMPPSDVCDDATFIRRVTIDVTGKLPTPERSQRFIADTDANKRSKYIEMGKSTNRRLLFNVSQAKSYMQTLLVAGGWAGGRHFLRADPQDFRRLTIGLLMALAILGLGKAVFS